ncbi:MAG: protein translocase subunit SecF [Candidatus Pacearchaeota archaeon]|nr:protein translocase subunit SecF [Candidatus Pacearchaeota archaeon]
METQEKNWFDKNYKLILMIPIILMIISLVYLGIFYSKHGDIINKDVSLSGGTTISLIGNFDTTAIEAELKKDFSDITFRKITDITTGKQSSFVIESSATPDQLKPKIEKIVGNLTSGNSSIEFTGPVLAVNFYKQLIIALIISFILMSLVVAFSFRTFIPCLAVIFAAFSDIVMPLALLNAFGVKISAAGIAAFLMLIGYSVDTDLLLTSRALKKKEGNLNQRIYGAFKTGIIMTLTSLAAVIPVFFILSGLPDSFRQIFLILTLGLIADIINTWLTNAGIIKWYCDKKGIK